MHLRPASPFDPAGSPVEQLLARSTQVWRGRETVRAEAVRSGFGVLDAALPGGGWPLGALIEIVPCCEGLGELRLTLPALARWSQGGRTIAFVGPPYTPYAPALTKAGVVLQHLLWITCKRDEDRLWAAEQLLREGAAAVLLWSAVREDRELRRLQLAAEMGKACGFLYRTHGTLYNASPAALRIALSSERGELLVSLVKVRGGHPTTLRLSLPLSCV